MEDSISYFENPEITWDIAELDRSLFGKMLETKGELGEVLSSLRKRIPVATTVTPFEGEYYRPAFHNRAFYKDLAKNGGFVAYKGTEIFAKDLAKRFSSLTRRRLHFTVFNAIERYPIEEQTVSLALSLDEAQSEAQAALDIHRVYHSRYGEFAELPFPIAVIKWPETAVKKFLEAKKPYLSDRAWYLTERLVATEGLGTYIYFHPGPKPHRILHLGGEILNSGISLEDYGAREAQLLKRGIDVKVFMKKYLRLAARLLACGFFPGSAPYMKNGFATDPQNVLTSGAFVDLGNCVAMKKIRLDHEFYQNWSLALLTLRRTSRALFTDTFMPFWGMHHDDDPLQSLVAGYVWQQFNEYIREEWARGGAENDPRLTQILEKMDPLDGLRESLRCLYQVEEQQGLGSETKNMPLMFRQK